MSPKEIQEAVIAEDCETFALRAMLFDGLAIVAVSAEIFRLEISDLTARIETDLA